MVIGCTSVVDGIFFINFSQGNLLKLTVLNSKRSDDFEQPMSIHLDVEKAIALSSASV